MGVKHKLYRGFPDWKCKQCSQVWSRECRAYKPPGSYEEYLARKDKPAACGAQDGTPLKDRTLCPPFVEAISDQSKSDQ